MIAVMARAAMAQIIRQKKPASFGFCVGNLTRTQALEMGFVNTVLFPMTVSEEETIASCKEIFATHPLLCVCLKAAFKC